MAAAARLLRWLYLSEAWVAGIAFAGVAIAIFAEVVARGVFKTALFGAQRFAVYCMIVSAMIGFALVVHWGSHLRIGAIDRLAPQRWNTLLNRLADAVSCGLCLFLGWWAVKFVAISFASGDRGMALGILVWPIQASLVWMFVSAALRYGVYALHPPLRPAAPEIG